MSNTQPARVVLGPMPCIDCGRLVVWDGEYLLFAGTRIIHVRATCPASYSGRGKKRGKGGRRG